MEISQELEKYTEENSSEEPQILKQLRRETYQKTTQPHMLSGYLQGRLLSAISYMINPKLIVEIGTFTGYSTLCLAEGLSENGKIISIDKNLETAYLPEKYFSQSPYSSKIEYWKKNALEALNDIQDSIDLIFLDADKENYSNYLDICKPKLRKNGIILADNILWKGKVLQETSDKKTQIIKEFNQKVKNDPDLEVIILPLRDGISVIRKK